ncbi:MAG: hypothetical protein SPLUMA1_SPLUMAMAG1_01260 [uncultured Sulfurimonas sp.]|nr:MAG: hypothetical protein SPLUMA1_SPLUMAMAG1_01260 [uncultured Sulfurimonas sp.]
MLFSVANEALGNEVISLIYENETSNGAVVHDLITEELEAYISKGTYISTGGYGRIYKQTRELSKTTYSKDRLYTKCKSAI